MSPRLLVLLAGLLLIPAAPADAQSRPARELRVPEIFRRPLPGRSRDLRVPRGFDRRVSAAERARARRAELRTPARWRR